MIVLKTTNLTVSYHKRPAIKGINLEIESGSIVGVIGPNGAGKSTLFKGILGLMKPDTGETEIFGKTVKENLRRVTYIPQKEQFDWDFPINVFDLAMMGRYPHISYFGKPSANDKQIVIESLEKVGMRKYAGTQIRNLSGGQQQRVFIARALAQQSDLLMLDEPFVGVDAKTEEVILELMKELSAQGKTIMVVHHDLVRVRDYFDKLALINQTLVAYGDTEDVFTRELIHKTYGGKLTILQKIEELDRT
jgi:manganese/zinc/iron transport system ATP- binding protein